MNILVLGGTGMLGHKMFQYLRQRFEGTYCAIRGSVYDGRFRKVDLFLQGRVIEQFDATQCDRAETLLLQHRPRAVINCIGVIKQRAEATCPIPSIMINSLWPHKLAQLADRWGGHLIHFSTDCVFNGKRGSYCEQDTSDAEDLYGKSKFLGEVAAHNALTLRTSIIGRELSEHRSLLDWFLGQNHRVVRGFRRVIYSGVTTNHLAEIVASIIQNHPGLHGLYQVASDPISKYDLLCLLRDAYRLDIQIEPDDIEVSDRSMKCDRLREAIGYVCPPWPMLVQQLAEDRTPYDVWLN